MSINSEAVTLMLVVGAAWGFVRLMADAIIGGASLSVWIHHKIAERDQ